MATQGIKIIWAIVKRNGTQKGYWTRIGAAFENRDGSWNQKFDLFPTDPQTAIQLRDPKPEDTADVPEAPLVTGPLSS